MRRARKFDTPSGPVYAFDIFEATSLAYPDKHLVEQFRKVRRYCQPAEDAVASCVYPGTHEDARQRAEESGVPVGYSPSCGEVTVYFSPPEAKGTHEGTEYPDFRDCEELIFPSAATDIQKRAFELDLAGFDLAGPNSRPWSPLRSRDLLSTELEGIQLILDGRLVAVNDHAHELDLPATSQSDVGGLYLLTDMPVGTLQVGCTNKPNLSVYGCGAKKEPGLAVTVLTPEKSIAKLPYQTLFPATQPAKLPKPTSAKAAFVIGSVVWHPVSRRFGRVERASSAAEVEVHFSNDETVVDIETSFELFDVTRVAKAKPDFLVAVCLTMVTMHADFAQGDYDVAKEFTRQIAHALGREDAIESLDRPWPPCALITDSDAEIARLLFMEFGPHLVFNEGILRRYNPKLGVWEDFSGIRGMIARLTNHFTYVYGSIHPKPFSCGVKAQSSIEASLFELVRDDTWRKDVPPGIAFTNGFLTLSNDYNPVIRKHKPENKAIHSTGVDWDFSADCTHFKHFIYTQAGGNVYGDFIMGVTGAALLGRATDLDVALFLLGDGGTGKSTTIEALKLMFPKSALSSVTLQDLSGQRGEYYRAQLTGKLFNAVEELPNNAISDTSTFKALVSGGEMEARHPGGRPFTLSPCAAHVFCLNEMPMVSDTSDGFYRRLAIIKYDLKIKAAISRRSNIELFRSELAGIYKFAVLECGVLLRRRMDMDVFVPSEISGAAKESRRHGESVQSFLTDCVLEAPDDSEEVTSHRGLYECYRQYCRAAGMHPVSNPQFGRRLNHLLKDHHRVRKSKGVFWRLTIRLLRHWPVTVDELRFPTDPGKIYWVDQ